MDTKLTNSYNPVSFKVMIVTTHKECHIVTTKLTSLCYLKTYELKALDCRLKATSAFYCKIKLYIGLKC
ncbi:hypothetical protein [Priestia megaterium]|uniref:hypothetical protein n=1 Tax=Priestia megaterium TaxID=1404 RepID=UPI000BF2C7DD|nr:hypothetical protein [Priestia megaterium]MCM3185622.1 hypothetical protein [Priestia megaterium]PFR94876.1 hypothetical protein COK39_15240 [Priestia megaterium]